jgi:hypothetical protein
MPKITLPKIFAGAVKSIYEIYAMLSQNLPKKFPFILVYSSNQG